MLARLFPLLVVASLNAALSQQPAANPSSDSPDIRAKHARDATAKVIRKKDFEQFAPYWTAEGGWHTELQLRNNLAAENIVTVLRGGTETISAALQKNGIALDANSLREALGHPKAEIRGLAAVQLASYGAKEDARYIHDALEAERDPITKANMATALAALDPVDGHNQYVAICNDDLTPDYVRLTVSRHDITEFDAKQCIASVLKIATHAEDLGTIQGALGLFPKLLQLGVDAITLRDILQGALASHDPQVRIAAAEESIHVFGATAKEMIKNALTSERDPVVKDRMQKLLDQKP